MERSQHDGSKWSRCAATGDRDEGEAARDRDEGEAARAVCSGYQREGGRVHIAVPSGRVQRQSFTAASTLILVVGLPHVLRRARCMRQN